MTNEEKEKLFLEFHSIRSGLSLIHDNEKEIDQINADLQKQADERSKLESDNNLLSKNIKNKQTEIIRVESQISNLEEKKSTINIRQKAKSKESPYFPIGWLILIVACVAALVCIFIFYAPDAFAVEYPEIAISVLEFIIVLGIVVGPGIFFTIRFFQGLNKMMKFKSKLLADSYQEDVECSTLIPQLKERIVKINDQIAASEDSIAKNNELLALPVEVPQRLIELERNNSIILESLITNHTSVICRDDWKYTDLLIYYISTGRAESLKEALQLVDRQVQTDQIVSSIEKLNETLNSTLIQGFKFLGEVIDTNLKELSFQVSSLSVGVMKTHSLILKEVDIQKSLENNLHTSSVELCSRLDKIQEASKFNEEKIIDAVNKIVKNTSNK